MPLRRMFTVSAAPRAPGRTMAACTFSRAVTATPNVPASIAVDTTSQGTGIAPLASTQALARARTPLSSNDPTRNGRGLIRSMARPPMTFDTASASANTTATTPTPNSPPRVSVTYPSRVASRAPTDAAARTSAAISQAKRGVGRSCVHAPGARPTAGGRTDVVIGS